MRHVVPVADPRDAHAREPPAGVRGHRLEIGEELARVGAFVVSSCGDERLFLQLDF